MPVVQVGNITLGQGLPKICVPLTAQNKPALLGQAAAAKAAGAQLIEWRADYYAGLARPGALAEALAALRGALGETPLLFTIRTAGEGGEWDGPPAVYQQLNEEAARSGLVDMLDIQLYCGQQVVHGLVQAAKAHGVVPVVSNHDFDKTPPVQEMAVRLRRMQALGAGIAKLAVTPRAPADTLALLAATDEVVQGGLGCPVITMAMGEMGVISRVAGAFFGSCVTFGAVGAASAPGQIEARALGGIIKVLGNGGL